MSREFEVAETRRSPSIADGAWRRELLFRLAEIDGVSSTPLTTATLADAKRRELESFTAQDQVRADLAMLDKPETRVAMLTALGGAIHRCRRSYVTDSIIGFAAICVVTGVATFNVVARLVSAGASDVAPSPVAALAVVAEPPAPVRPETSAAPAAPVHTPTRERVRELAREIALSRPETKTHALTSVVGENGEFFVPVALPMDPPGSSADGQDVVISGIPDGIFATAGDAIGAGVVVLPVADLAMLRFVTNAVSPLTFALDFAIRDSTGAIRTHSRAQVDLQRPAPAVAVTASLGAQAETPARGVTVAKADEAHPVAAAPAPKRRLAAAPKPAAVEKPAPARATPPPVRSAEKDESDKRQSAAALIRNKRMAVGRAPGDTPPPAQAQAAPAQKPWWQKPAPDWSPSIVDQK